MLFSYLPFRKAFNTSSDFETVIRKENTPCGAGIGEMAVFLRPKVQLLNKQVQQAAIPLNCVLFPKSCLMRFTGKIFVFLISLGFNYFGSAASWIENKAKKQTWSSL